MNNKMGPVTLPEKNAEMLYKWESCPDENVGCGLSQSCLQRGAPPAVRLKFSE
jgi:hypothetical protein